MKILYHHRTQGQEPESVHIAEIVAAMRDLGYEVRVIGPIPANESGTSSDSPSWLGRVKKNSPIWIFELLQIAYNLVVYIRLSRNIVTFRPDMIYERYALHSFAGVLAARYHGLPLVLEVNTPYAQAWAHYYGLYFRRLARWVERKVLMTATFVITVTETQRNMLIREGVPPDKVDVCHNAINPQCFDPQRFQASSNRMKLALEGIVVGFVGTMNRWQGMDAFPKVIDAVLSKHADVCFLLVGDGEFRKQLEDFCASKGYSGRVIFTGRKKHSEIPDLVSLMDIAILLSSNEYGSPMKIFEYLGMAKPVIAPSVAPVVEVLRDGETGLLIQPGNSFEMAEKISYLVENPKIRYELGMAGHAYVNANHTWSHNVRKIMDAFDSVKDKFPNKP
jgi:glycosyltransferase involved in cell wall biosynthesis